MRFRIWKLLLSFGLLLFSCTTLAQTAEDPKIFGTGDPVPGVPGSQISEIWDFEALTDGTLFVRADYNTSTGYPIGLFRIDPDLTKTALFKNGDVISGLPDPLERVLDFEINRDKGSLLFTATHNINSSLATVPWIYNLSTKQASIISLPLKANTSRSGYLTFPVESGVLGSLPYYDASNNLQQDPINAVNGAFVAEESVDAYAANSTGKVLFESYLSGYLQGNVTETQGMAGGLFLSNGGAIQKVFFRGETAPGTGGTWGDSGNLSMMSDGRFYFSNFIQGVDRLAWWAGSSPADLSLIVQTGTAMPGFSSYQTDWDIPTNINISLGAQVYPNFPNLLPVDGTHFYLGLDGKPTGTITTYTFAHGIYYGTVGGSLTPLVRALDDGSLVTTTNAGDFGFTNVEPYAVQPDGSLIFVGDGQFTDPALQTTSTAHIWSVDPTGSNITLLVSADQLEPYWGPIAPGGLNDNGDLLINQGIFLGAAVWLKSGGNISQVRGFNADWTYTDPNTNLDVTVTPDRYAITNDNLILYGIGPDAVYGEHTLYKIAISHANDYIWSGPDGSASNCSTDNWHTLCDDGSGGKISEWKDKVDVDHTDAPTTDADVTITNADVIIDQEPVSVKTIDASGSLTVQQDLTLTGTGQSTIEDLKLDATLSTMGPLSLTGGNGKWSSGDIYTQDPGITIANGSTFAIDLGTSTPILYGNITNEGTLNYDSGSLTLYTAPGGGLPASLRNNGKLFLKQGEINLDNAGSNLSWDYFVSHGDLRKITNGDFDINVPYSIDGTLAVEAGTLNLNSPDTSSAIGDTDLRIDNGATLNLTGLVKLPGNTTVVNDGTLIAKNVTLTIGNLKNLPGNGDLRIENGVLQFIKGTASLENQGNLVLKDLKLDAFANHFSLSGSPDISKVTDIDNKNSGELKFEGAIVVDETNIVNAGTVVVENGVTISNLIKDVSSRLMNTGLVRLKGNNSLDIAYDGENGDFWVDTPGSGDWVHIRDNYQQSGGELKITSGNVSFKDHALFSNGTLITPAPGTRLEFSDSVALAPSNVVDFSGDVLIQGGGTVKVADSRFLKFAGGATTVTANLTGDGQFLLQGDINSSQGRLENFGNFSIDQADVGFSDTSPNAPPQFQLANESGATMTVGSEGLVPYSLKFKGMLTNSGNFNLLDPLTMTQDSSFTQDDGVLSIGDRGAIYAVTSGNIAGELNLNGGELVKTGNTLSMVDSNLHVTGADIKVQEGVLSFSGFSNFDGGNRLNVSNNAELDFTNQVSLTGGRLTAMLDGKLDISQPGAGGGLVIKDGAALDIQSSDTGQFVIDDTFVSLEGSGDQLLLSGATEWKGGTIEGDGGVRNTGALHLTGSTGHNFNAGKLNNTAEIRIDKDVTLQLKLPATGTVINNQTGGEIVISGSVVESGSTSASSYDPPRFENNGRIKFDNAGGNAELLLDINSSFYNADSGIIEVMDNTAARIRGIRNLTIASIGNVVTNANLVDGNYIVHDNASLELTNEQNGIPVGTNIVGLGGNARLRLYGDGTLNNLPMRGSFSGEQTFEIFGTLELMDGASWQGGPIEMRDPLLTGDSGPNLYIDPTSNMTFRYSGFNGVGPNNYPAGLKVPKTGTLVVDGALSITKKIKDFRIPVIDVLGTLAGNGTITAHVIDTTGTVPGTLNIQGIVRPGHSPGVLTVNGDYNQTSAGTLEIEIGGTAAGTEYDQLVVNGTATFEQGANIDISFIDLNGGGQVFVPSTGDTFDFLKVDNLVLADGTELGDYLHFTNLPDGLRWNIQSTQVDGLTVWELNTIFGTTFVTDLAGLSGNALNVATALDSITHEKTSGGFLDFALEVQNLGDRDSVVSSLGAVGFNSATALFDLAEKSIDAGMAHISRRVNNIIWGGSRTTPSASASLASLQLQTGSVRMPRSQDNLRNLILMAAGSGSGGPVTYSITNELRTVMSVSAETGSYDASSNQIGFGYTGYSFSFGLETGSMEDDDWTMGTYMTHSWLEGNADDNLSEVDFDNTSFGFYGVTRLQDKFYLDGNFSYHWSDAASNRTVSLPTQGYRALGGTGGRGFSAHGRLTYPLAVESLNIGLYSELAYLSINLDGITESSNSPAALDIDGSDADNFSGAIGVTVAGEPGGNWMPVIDLAWERVLINNAAVLNASFKESPATDFAILTDSNSKNIFRVQAGINGVIKKKYYISAGYNGRFSGNYHEHAFNLQAAFNF